MQGDHPQYLKTAACAKHYAVHSGPEKLRHGFTAGVSVRYLHATYLPAFKKLVTEAKVEAVMGAYNRVNGEPCCAHSYLIGDLLEERWGFTGHFASDCGAVADISAATSLPKARPKPPPSHRERVRSGMREHFPTPRRGARAWPDRRGRSRPCLEPHFHHPLQTGDVRPTRAGALRLDTDERSRL